MQTVYIAGPMSWYPDFNFPAFIEAAFDLREQGYVVYNPVEFDQPEEVEEHSKEQGLGTASPMWRRFLARDLEIVLTKVDAVVVLPDWARSVGATLEVTAALAAQKKVYSYADGMVELPLESPIPMWFYAPELFV